MIVAMAGSTMLIRSEMRANTTYMKAGCLDLNCTIEIAEHREGANSYLTITHGDDILTVPNEPNCHKDFITWAEAVHQKQAHGEAVG